MEPPTGSISVTVLNETTEPVDTERWAALVRRVLETEGVTAPAETNVVFVDSDTMAELNAEHMGSDGPTDVLSFPIDDEDLPISGGSDGSSSDETAIPRLVGDIVVCGAVAEANAPEHAGTLDDEIALLLVHGSLHLLGHDHADADERTEMWAAEQRLLADLWGPLARDPWVAS